MKVSLKVVSLLMLFESLFAVTILQAQDSTMKHQVGIGSYPTIITDPYIEIHFKTFFHKKKFYNISLVSWLLHNESTATYDRFDYLFIPSAEIGVSLPFFKICRFNAAARTSFYIRRSETDYNFSSENGYYKQTGGFIGPSLGLEVIPVKTEKFMLSLFGYMHVGFGYSHDKSYSLNGVHVYTYDQTDKNAIGFIATGVAIRF